MDWFENTSRKHNQNHSFLLLDQASSSTLAVPPPPLLIFFLFSLPGLPPPRGDVFAKSILFSESTFTMNEAIFTNYLPTLQKLVKNICQLPDVTMSDFDTSIMDSLALVTFENFGLKSSFQKFGDGQSQDVIEFSLSWLEETVGVHSSHEGFSFEYPSWVIGLEEQKFSGSLSNSGEG